MSTEHKLFQAEAILAAKKAKGDVLGEAMWAGTVAMLKRELQEKKK